MFTHLHLHTHYSLLQALGEPKAYISKAKELGMEALAITDYNGLYGAIEHYKYCKKMGIKPIIGVELGLVQDYRIKTSNEHSSNIVLLAKDSTGYHNLLQLVSHANLEGRHGKARIDLSLLKTYATGLYCLIGGKQSLLGSMIISDEQTQKQEEYITKLLTMFGNENLILECIVGNETLDPSIRVINNHAIRLAQKHQITLTCSPIVHLVNQKDIYSYEVFLCIKENRRIFDTDRPKVTQPVWMLSEDEVQQIMLNSGYDVSLIDTMIQNTSNIAASIHIDISLGKAMFPKYQSPPYIEQLFARYQ